MWNKRMRITRLANIATLASTQFPYRWHNGPRVKAWLLGTALQCFLCIVTLPSMAATLIDEHFNTDVIASRDWIASDASVSVDVANGWLRIGSNGAVDDGADKYGSFPLPLVIEWRERTYTGNPGIGPYFSLPKLELYWGPTDNDHYAITYADIDNTGLGGWLLGRWTNILTLGPANWNQWRTVKAIIRRDGGELFAKVDGDLDFTPIVSSAWTIPDLLVRFRLSQHTDDVSDFDYVRVTAFRPQAWCDDFETGLTHWTPYQYPSGWTATTTNPHSGLTCAAFTFPRGAGYYDACMLSASGLFNVVAGVTYRVTYWIREQNTHDTWDPNASILDMNLIDGGANNRIAPFDLPISSEWHFVEGTVTASVSGPASIDVQLHGYATSSDAVFAIDDICIAPCPPVPLQVYVDIKPGSCPNPLNIRNVALPYEGPENQTTDATGAARLTPFETKPAKNVLPVAILGAQDFDVSQIDPASVKLAGVSAIRWSLEDVATPAGTNGSCVCNALGSDGYADLTLKFYAEEIARALGTVHVGDYVTVTMTGKLLDGTGIEGTDCVLMVGNQPGAVAQMPTKLCNYPNPFNPTTNISFSLPVASDYTLSIYNVNGQLVEEFNGHSEAGTASLTWDGSKMASGVYLYRLAASDFAETKKMLMLK